MTIIKWCLFGVSCWNLSLWNVAIGSKMFVISAMTIRHQIFIGVSATDHEHFSGPKGISYAIFLTNFHCYLRTIKYVTISVFPSSCWQWSSITPATFWKKQVYLKHLLLSSGAHFSKVLIINGPGIKAVFVYIKDQGFNSFASNMIKLSVNETNGVVC